MKKTIVFLLIILILFSTFCLTVQGGIKIWPGKLYIEMNKWVDEDKEIIHPIQIINPYSYGVNITTKIENPSTKTITDRFSSLPNITWITTSPENVYIPPKSSENIEINIKIPEDQQELYYNEKWETGIVITSDIPIGPGEGGMNFELEIAVKLFIITPKSKVEEFQYYYIFIVIFSIIILYVINLYFKNKKEKLKSIYYFKNKK